MRRNLKWTLPVAAVLAALPAAASGQELPAGVTAETIEQGKQIFHGDGLCVSCHGQDGQGTPIAPILADATWLHIDGSFDALVGLITKGVDAPKEAPIPMLPKGGSSITDDQVKAVAAYVWKLSHGG